MYETQGPSFSVEPLGKVVMTNTQGGRLDCAARGNPAPRIQWTGTDTSQVHSIPGIRTILSNGSLYFPPFKADSFRQDVHWAVYRCVLTNSVGTVVSRDVILRAGNEQIIFMCFVNIFCHSLSLLSLTVKTQGRVRMCDHNENSKQNVGLLENSIYN